MLLDLIPEARREILKLLKRRGPLPVEDLAEALSITVSGARQHLAGLERDGVVTYQRIRQGPGRPRHFYELTEEGDALFPRRAAELTNELLGYVQEHDPTLLDQLFVRRAQRRVRSAQRRLEGLSLPDKVRELARILDEEGYYAELQELEGGRFRIVERNCLVKDVALRYAQVCTSELNFVRKVLPEADVTRNVHVINNQPCCAYEIRPKALHPEAELRVARGVKG
jgi:predicted ArsR family transcriptional regulator